MVSRRKPRKYPMQYKRPDVRVRCERCARCGELLPIGIWNEIESVVSQGGPFRTTKIGQPPRRRKSRGELRCYDAQSCRRRRRKA